MFGKGKRSPSSSPSLTLHSTHHGAGRRSPFGMVRALEKASDCPHRPDLADTRRPRSITISKPDQRSLKCALPSRIVVTSISPVLDRFLKMGTEHKRHK